MTFPTSGETREQCKSSLRPSTAPHHHLFKDYGARAVVFLDVASRPAPAPPPSTTPVPPVATCGFQYFFSYIL
ncbi:hypothetical protein E2C01_014711 [Portunus trituberculatus]|uniref:Uncharacterized protein n=1 Tax=Portunus trituberculatus TaxID=210409 RepID=A0A5B7DKT8_PORTR|nr:hypothetical protein [Portunus trituberculatus]